jgi:two-component system, LytTR family, sensor kinase
MSVNKYHIYFWALFAISALILDYISYGNDFNIIRELIVIVIELWVFYSFYYSIKLFSKEKKSLIFISLLRFILGFIITIFLNYLRKLIAHYYSIYILNSIAALISDSIAFYIHLGLFAIGFYFVEKNSQKFKVIKKLEEKNTSLQQSLLQSDLNFLRAQINPHFLQNCLNFIYSDTRKTNPNAADAVMLLSTIMRYSVADNTSTGGMALLKDEITQVENVIQIHQLRFEQQLNIKFNKEGQFEHRQIVPMILLTLVENLIKYGDLNNSQCPAQIDCNIDENKKKIFFTAANKKSYTTDVISTGLGLKNIRERLGLIWGDNFTLQKEETDDYYTVKLCMPYTEIKDNINKMTKINLSILNPKPLNT